ncbi:MAG: hypothetical protein OHK003_04180 [Anaerolineales bacterium]
MTNLFDALEFCLREIEEGVDVDTALARFPEHAAELRPILKTSIKAREMAVPEPSLEVVRRSRSRVMQRAAELRELSAPKRRFSILPLQRLAIAFGLAAIFLLSGSGLLSASASSLPGERLYPVKRGWENVRLFFIFDSEARALLKHEFENERLHEAKELLTEGRHEVIEFAGVFMQVKGVTYVSGLQVILPVGMPQPANGDPVIVQGQTNAQGFVEVIRIDLLPEGSVVPAGSPIEMEVESDSEALEAPPAGSSSGSSEEATEPALKQFEIKGKLEAVSTSTLVVNGMTVHLQNSMIDGKLCVGMEVEVYGYYDKDGRFIVLKAKGKGECSGGAVPTLNNKSNLNQNDDQAKNTGDDVNPTKSNDDNDNNDNNDNNDDDGDKDKDSNDNNENDDD